MIFYFNFDNIQALCFNKKSALTLLEITPKVWGSVIESVSGFRYDTWLYHLRLTLEAFCALVFLTLKQCQSKYTTNTCVK